MKFFVSALFIFDFIFAAIMQAEEVEEIAGCSDVAPSINEMTLGVKDTLSHEMTDEPELNDSK